MSASPLMARSLAAAAVLAGAAAAGPRVVFTVVIDDLGWNNLAWHGNAEAATPHLAALAAEGVTLNRHYTHFTCTPSRSAFMTGRLPVHVQTTLANPDVQTAGIPRNMTTFANKLQAAGWYTAIAGKWDLGFATHAHTPEGRGFNSSLVYAEHMNYYYTQHICPTGTACDMNKYSWLTDLWDTGKPSDLNNTAYIETLFANRLTSVVANHDLDAAPLYLDYRSHVVHWPLQVPQEWYDRFAHITDDEPACGDKIPWVWPGANKSVLSCRRQYVAMTAIADEVVGNLTAMLKARGWWDQTLMIFTPDNGGSIATSENAASNYPLRGGKYMPMEGGIRTAAFVSGGYLPPSVRGTVLDAPVHIADWYATILGLAGLDPVDHKAAAAQPPLPPVDSLDVWPLISGANVTSPRLSWPVSEKVLIAFEQPPGSTAVTAGWKLVAGKLDSGAGWAGPVYPNASSPDSDPFSVGLDCSAGPSGACLFDVVADPTEHVDVAAAHTAKVTQLTAALAAASRGFYSNADVLTPACPPGTPGDCACWTAANVFGGYLGPWAL